MFKSYRVGTILGIPFKLDVTFLIILPIFAWLIGIQVGQAALLMNNTFGTSIDPDPLTQGIRPFLIGFVAAVALFACVSLHELGHSVVAMAYDYEIESITLWLLGGIAKPKELPKIWLHEFWIAIAGPIVNFIIVGICGLVLLVVPGIDLVVFLIIYLAILNVAIALFNLLPAFPLDGGRILRAVLARNNSYVRATRQAAAVGKGFAIFLGLVGLVLLDFILMAIALFVFIAATAESRQMMLDAAFEGVEVSEIMTEADELATVEADIPISELLDFMLEERHTGYPVLDTGEFVGIVTLSDVQEAEESAGDKLVRAAMTPAQELTTVQPTDEVMDAFHSLGNNEIGRLPVVTNDGELVGIITRTDLMRAFQIVMEQRRFENQQSRRPGDGSSMGDSPREEEYIRP